MGFFSIIKEACKVSFTWKKLFSHIAIGILLPLAALNLNEIQISHFIETNENARRLALSITELVYALVIVFFTLYSTSIVVTAVACFYTSKDVTFKNVSGAFSKVWGRLIVTFLWYLLFMVIYLGVAIGLLIWFGTTTGKGRNKIAILLLFLSVFYFIGLVYVTLIYNVATVVCVLEKDYGRKAFGRSRKLIKGKRWVSFFVYLILDIVFVGILVAYSLLVVNGNRLSLVGKVFVAIGCYLLMTVLLHFYFVIQTVIYFKCKSHHNESISDVARHLEDSYVQLVRENGAQRVSV
ncbi:uncharacterized protein LOC113358976 [Papaver somniferum]|uniref:uncharacterized protein LOC113358976 n=1 Tax=Papaver somniferum TaxID=3469 RepID=UPI000E6FB9E3|nr:uncharacterized protein LOC113358976 [Papaver somniferum]